MKRLFLCIGVAMALVAAVAANAVLARGFGGGGFRGGGGGFHGGGGFSRGGGGFSGAGYRPAPVRRPTPQRTPAFNQRFRGGGNAASRHPGVVHRPQTSNVERNIGSREPLRPGGSAGRRQPTPGEGHGPRPGLKPPSPELGGAGSRLPTNRPGEGGAGERRPGLRPNGGGEGARLPGLGPDRNGNRSPSSNNRLSNRETNINNRDTNIQVNSFKNSTISERHNDLTSRFNDLDQHWGDQDWVHRQWEGPNGGDLNHFGYWGPNGYWGHTGARGPNGGYWGRTGHVGPNGAWAHSGYYGPAGHWSRNWGWYNGYSPVWGYGSWDYLWYEYPVSMAFGVTMWGLNSVNWMFGVGNYYNPYATGPVYVNNQIITDYTEPVVGDPSYATQDNSTASNSASETDPLTETFTQAQKAFYNEQFDEALNLTNQALALAPQDAAINEFRSLCLFALGQYKEAAATIHAVLAAGPGWDWTTMISRYHNPDTYTAQLRRLEAAVKEDPDAADNQFLLAYHYLTGGHQEAALALWKKVVKLKPEDRLSAQFVKMYEPPADSKTSEPTPPPPELDKPAYPLEKLQGDWKAQDESGSFTLRLGKDDKFQWTFTRDDKPQTVSGVYAVRGDQLVMQPDSGGTMLSTITLKDDHTLEFAPIGNADKLTFTR